MSRYSAELFFLEEEEFDFSTLKLPINIDEVNVLPDRYYSKGIVIEKKLFTYLVKGLTIKDSANDKYIVLYLNDKNEYYGFDYVPRNLHLTDKELSKLSGYVFLEIPSYYANFDNVKTKNLLLCM